MSPRGIDVVVGGPVAVLRTLLISPFMGRKVLTFQASINKHDLVVLKELIEAKKVTPVIDRCYQLSEVPEAIRYLGEGHARGKVVITVEHDNKS
jgi:NADPH:quinone reductase-like Zn-dependent oxidoreductase